MWPNPQMVTSFADLVTITEEILNGKLHFFCTVTENPYSGVFYTVIVFIVLSTAR